MNYGWFDSETTDDEYRRVVLHEFGHALGLAHEHQSPGVAIPWNEQKVYDLLSNDETTLDEVIRGSGLTASVVSVILLGLEMKRLIRQLPGKLFTRNR